MRRVDEAGAGATGALRKLDLRSRLCLIEGTSAVAVDALKLENEKIVRSFLIEIGAKPANILAAKIGPMELKARGFDTPEMLKSFGFDGFHLCEPAFCNEMVNAFGRDATLEIFLVTAEDAVALAGGELLNISTTELLLRCAGFPLEAHAVLQQLPHGLSLKGVSPTILLDAGLRAQSLLKCGYGLERIVNQTGAGANELAKLGYGM